MTDPADGALARRRRLTLGIGIAAAALLLILTGGGAALLRRTDPSYKAEQLAQKGNPRAAAVELRNALRASPRDPALHQRLGELQMHLADPVAAEKEFRIARALGADRAEVVPQLADALLAQGLNEEVLRQVPTAGPSADSAAQFLYRRCVAQLALHDAEGAAATLAAARRAAPDSPAVMLIAARLSAAAEDYTATEAQVDEVLKRDPAQIDALLMKQQIVAARNDHAAALELSARAVDAAPWSAMAHIRHATELLYASEDEKAKADVEAVLAVQPRFMEAVYLKGILLARQGRYQDASVALNELDQVTGRFPPALYYKALIAANLGQAETADSLARRYNTLVPTDPDGIRLAARSDVAVHASDHAVAILQKAVAAGIEDAGIDDLLGSAQANLGNTPAALTAFTRALQLAPDEPGILTHMALAQIQAGNNGEAVGTLARTLEISPTQPLAGEALVSAAIGQNDLPKAEQALARLRDQVGDTLQVGLLAGLIEVRRGNLNGARDAFRSTLKRFPDSAQAKLYLARVRVQQGGRLEGMQAMAEVLAKDPANVPALDSYVPLLLQDRQLDRVIAILDAARAADPHQVGFIATLADALVLSGNPQRAVDTLQAVRADGPLPPLLLTALARAQAAAGKDDDAKASFRTVLQTQPDDVVDRTALIDLLLRSHDYAAAAAELRAGLDRAPRNSRFLSTLVELEAQTHGIEAGLALADQLRADPRHLPFSTLLKGDALMRAQRYNTAARAYLDEFKLDPSVPPLLRAVAALNAGGQADEAARLSNDWLAKTPNTPAVLESLAKLDLRAGRLQEAQRHLEALLTMTPNDTTALNNLAWTYQQRGDARARDIARKAYLQSGGADSADTLGWIMVRENEPAAALPLLRQAGSQMPSDPVVQYHLAAALQANGQMREAVPVLQAALANSATFPERPEAEKLMSQLPKDGR